jgi:hypothetical protein
MGPKKPKKTKAEIEAENLAREEEERKQVNRNLFLKITMAKLIFMGSN